MAHNRRRQMRRALKWSAGLFAGFLVVTQQVVTYGPIIQIDRFFSRADHPHFKGISAFIIRRLDDLGLRSISGIALLIVAIYISRRFKTWRPINLGILSFLSLNIVVGGFKYALGRTKPRIGLDVLHAGGMSYPSGHASNAIFIWGVIAYLIYRYTNRAPFQGINLYPIVGLITFIVVMVSLIRNTHWFSDLIGGVFIGGALLVAVIAIDRFIPSKKQPS